MKVTPTTIPEVLIIEPQIFYDQRGFFMESYNLKNYQKILGSHIHFVQDNQSSSKQGVFRGLHYQIAPQVQGKLVRVLHGSIFDIALDIRQDSQFFGQWVGVELSCDNQKQLWVPPGFAHGFLTISERADVLYKTTDYYNAHLERVIHWDDPDLKIVLPIDGLNTEIILSDKDVLSAKSFKNADIFI